eukprot:c5221_g1_i1 orf=236-583(+)
MQKRDKRVDNDTRWGPSQPSQGPSTSICFIIAQSMSYNFGDFFVCNACILVFLPWMVLEFASLCDSPLDTFMSLHSLLSSLFDPYSQAPSFNQPFLPIHFSSLFLASQRLNLCFP